MDTDEKTVVIKKLDYTVVVNKRDDTAVVIYGRELVARTRRNYLTWFVSCVILAILVLVLAIMELTWDNTAAAALYFVLVVAFGRLSGFFWTQFACFRDCLRALEKPTIKGKG